MLKNITLCLALALPALSACQPQGDDVDPGQPRAEQVLHGQTVSIDLGDAEVTPDQLRDIARATEDLGEVAQAKVKVKKLGSGTIMELELWGGELPGAQELESELRDSFPILAEAEITVASLGTMEAGTGPDGELGEDLKDASVEEVKAAVEQRLRDEGVTGEIKVEVIDGPDGRRVEVGVDKHCTGEEPDCD